MSNFEMWRPAVGWFGYLVSDRGRVMSMHNPRSPSIKATSVSPAGYEIVFLHRDGRQHSVRMHRLVGEAYLGPRPAGLETRHLNGNSLDNRLVNLRYGTPTENQRDKLRHGTHHLANKTHCPQGHPYDEANTYRAPGVTSRACRTCRRAKMKALYEQRKAS